MRDHGGNIDGAIARFGGTDWIDLSTGINRVPFPVPALAPDAAAKEQCADDHNENRQNIESPSGIHGLFPFKSPRDYAGANLSLHTNTLTNTDSATKANDSCII